MVGSFKRFQTGKVSTLKVDRESLIQCLEKFYDAAAVEMSVKMFEGTAMTMTIYLASDAEKIIPFFSAIRTHYPTYSKEMLSCALAKCEPRKVADSELRNMLVDFENFDVNDFVKSLESFYVILDFHLDWEYVSLFEKSDYTGVLVLERD